MIDLGFQVAVIEQVEDKRENEERCKMRQNVRVEKGPDALVKRQICGIFTKGLMPNSGAVGATTSENSVNTDYDSKWVLALYSEYRTAAQGPRTSAYMRTIRIGVAFFDNTTL